jgi:hypothetical protein
MDDDDHDMMIMQLSIDQFMQYLQMHNRSYVSILEIVMLS